jgi:hypothetical protein
MTTLNQKLFEGETIISLKFDKISIETYFVRASEKGPKFSGKNYMKFASDMEWCPFQTWTQSNKICSYCTVLRNEL